MPFPSHRKSHTGVGDEQGWDEGLTRETPRVQNIRSKGQCRGSLENEPLLMCWLYVPSLLHPSPSPGDCPEVKQRLGRLMAAPPEERSNSVCYSDLWDTAQGGTWYLDWLVFRLVAQDGTFDGP